MNSSRLPTTAPETFLTVNRVQLYLQFGNNK